MGEVCVDEVELEIVYLVTGRVFVGLGGTAMEGDGLWRKSSLEWYMS